MMKTFKHVLSLVLLLLVFCPTTILAESESVTLKVGETKKLEVPYSVTGQDGYKVTSSWSSYDRDVVQIVDYGEKYVKVKVLKYSSSTIYVSCYYKTSNISSAKFEYNISISKPKFNLSASPSGGTVEKGKTVYLNCEVSNVEDRYASQTKIYYRVDGYTPTTSDRQYDSYSGISINKTCALKAIATWGGAQSDVLTANYTVKEEKEETKLTLSASPSGGTVSKGTTVYLTASEYGSDIYYTLDGATPSKSSYYYSSGITINESCTLKAIAYKSGYKDSDVLTENYTVSSDPEPEPEPTPTPTPTPPPAPSGSIEINATNFPDTNFRNYLLEQYFGKDGYFTEDEINQITNIDVSNKEIGSLEGIELFTTLEYLYCSNNKLSTLDISKNSNLTFLSCSQNQLTSLDVSKNTKLEILNCSQNTLSTLDISRNAELSDLSIAYCQLLSLDVSRNRKLKELYCSQNELSLLDISNNIELTTLVCSRNHLSSLDVSNNIALKYLSCDINEIKSLHIDNCINLESLSCAFNQLSKLDIMNNKELKGLDCLGNKLQSLDLSNNKKLEGLRCAQNQLTSLDLSNNEALSELHCYHNQLLSLDVCNNKRLIELSCHYNQIKGSSMDALINSLPQNKTKELYKINIISQGREGNVCTTLQVAAIKAKGWTPYHYVHPDWVEYEGCDPSGLINIMQDKDKENPAFDLSGKRLKKPHKGINIINGKKIVVK